MVAMLNSSSFTPEGVDNLKCAVDPMICTHKYLGIVCYGYGVTVLEIKFLVHLPQNMSFISYVQNSTCPDQLFSSTSSKFYLHCRVAEYQFPLTLSPSDVLTTEADSLPHCCRDYFVNVPSQWETTLHCKVVSLSGCIHKMIPLGEIDLKGKGKIDRRYQITTKYNKLHSMRITKLN